MSDSLLTHILIENFLNAHPQIKFSLLKENNEVGLHKALKPGEIFDQTDENEVFEPHLHKALTSKEKSKIILTPEQTQSLINPKKTNSLLNKAAKYFAIIGMPLTLAASLYSADISKSKDQPVNVPEIVNQIDNSNLNDKDKENLSNDIEINSQIDEFGPKVIYKAKRPADFDKIVSDFIISNEGFTSKPHSDVKQVSIGHGTSVVDGTTQIPENWKETLYSKYDVPKEKQKFDPKGGISKETARYIFNIKYEKNKQILDDIKYIHVFPEQIQKIIFDLAFNMGTNFFTKFRNFNTALQQAAECLSGFTITPEDIDNANTHLYVASTELLRNYDKEGKETGLTKYASDLKSRAEVNAKIIRNGVSIDDFEIHVSEIPYSSYPDTTNENKKYSLKNIFFS